MSTPEPRKPSLVHRLWQSCPPSQRFMPEKYKTSLESLPSELLMDIAALLVPRPFRDRPNPQPSQSDEEIQGRVALQNLCLVSTKFNCIARPYLFRHIAVSDSKVLNLLSRTLTENPDLGELVYRLDFEVAVHDSDDRHVKFDFSTLASEQIPEIFATWNSSFHNSMYYLEHELICWLYFDILRKTPKLKWLTINMQPEYILQSRLNIEILSKTFYPLAKRVSRAANESQAGVPFLPRIQTLALLGDPTVPYAPFPAGLAEHFLGLGSLKELITFRDDGKWATRLPPPGQESLGIMSITRTFDTITSMNLDKSHCLPSDIYDICTSFPCLKSLSVTVDAVDGYARLRVSSQLPIDVGKYLSDGLAKLTHLESLSLDLHYNFDVRGRLGRSNCLDLHSLSKLRDLRVRIDFLIALWTGGLGNGEPSRPSLVCSLDSVLPPALESLIVWTDRNCRLGLKEYNLNAVVVDFLTRLSHLAGPNGKFPKLRDVSYRYGIGVQYPLHLYRGEDRDDFAALLEAFAKKDVHFSEEVEEAVDNGHPW